MTKKLNVQIRYPEIGICGLSCRLCPRYHIESKSRCGGCKSKFRMSAGCPFITCAIKKKEIEFCWQCKENETCEKWRKHREFSKQVDSFICYQKLEDNVAFIQKNGVNEFGKVQKTRENLLKEMLQEFNEGRSKSYYCVAATILEIEELEDVLTKAKKKSTVLEVKDKSKVLHSMLDELAGRKDYYLKLRK